MPVNKTLTHFWMASDEGQMQHTAQNTLVHSICFYCGFVLNFKVGLLGNNNVHFIVNDRYVHVHEDNAKF